MQLVKKIFSRKNTYILILGLVFLLGIFLRLWNLNKPDGLWIDEIDSYYLAKESFPFGILQALVTKSYHTPLYFFILHIWMNLFGDNDFIIRFLSAFFGILAIPVTYMAGKELDSRKVGILAAMLVSINSLLIYYSQEVRIYSLLVFFCVLAVLFILKIKNYDGKKNYAGLIVANLGILYTFNIGFVFLFWEFVLISLYFYFNNREKLKGFVYSQLIAFGLFLPYLPSLFYEITNSAKGPMAFDIHFDPTQILAPVQSWFSPIILGLYNPLSDYYGVMLSHGINFKLIFFIIFPVAIYLLAIGNSFKKNRFNIVLFLIAFMFFLTEIAAAAIGKLDLVTRYTIISLPIFLIVASYGMSKIGNKFLYRFLTGLLIIINLLYLIYVPNSAPKMPRSEGLKAAADILNKFSFNKNDMIIMPYAGIYFNKYYSKATIVPFNIFDLEYGLKAEKFMDKKLILSLNKENVYDQLKDYLSSPGIPSPLENYMNKEVLQKLSKNHFLIVILAPMVQYPISESDLKGVINNDSLYRTIPIFVLVNSKVINGLNEYNMRNLRFIAETDKSSWKVFIFQKK